ncbi:MAG: DUF1993 domain-containing protein [Sphingomonadales bacterium]|nr:DUF1993 domain-containing protein [Sphingomonadales bacterium]
MTYTPYQSAIHGFVAMLGDIKCWLDKAASQKDEAALVDARLAPDMHPLARQVQMASDAAKGAAARLTGTQAPAMPDTETTFAELKVRCDKTIAYLQSVDAAAFDAGIEREIVITFPNGAGLRFDGATFLTGFAVPNFYFHAAMTYAILRAEGVELGKADYLTHLGPYMFAPPEKVAG